MLHSLILSRRVHESCESKSNDLWFDNLPVTTVLLDATLKHWVKKYGWKEESKTMIFIANQDENIKTKNITEKIDFENVAGLMAACL